MCKESILANLASGKLLAVKPSNMYTVIDLKALDVGFASISNLHCINNIQGAIVEGKDKSGNKMMSIIHGNVSEDGRSRWIFTTNFDGEIVHVGSSGTEVVLISTAKSDGKSTTMKSYVAWFRGPYIMYGDGLLNTNQFTFTVTTPDGKGSDQKTMTFNFIDPEDTLTLTTGTPLSPTRGFYNLNDIATFTGPLFSLSASNDMEDGKKPKEASRLLAK